MWTLEASKMSMYASFLQCERTVYLNDFMYLIGFMYSPTIFMYLIVFNVFPYNRFVPAIVPCIQATITSFSRFLLGFGS